MLLWLAVLVGQSRSQALDAVVKDYTDGDTVKADINMPFDVTLRNQEIRFLGFDAWEVTKKRQSVVVTDAEVIKGAKAKIAFKTWAAGKKFTIVPGDKPRDNYGRILAYGFFDKQSLADFMIKNDHDRNTKPDGTKRD